MKVLIIDRDIVKDKVLMDVMMIRVTKGERVLHCLIAVT